MSDRVVGEILGIHYFEYSQHRGGGGGHGGGVLGNDLISLKIPIGIPVIAWWGF